MADVHKTVMSSGGDYSTLAGWESGEQKNLVTATENAFADCYPFVDSSSSSTTVAGWTANATYRITIAGTTRPTGIWTPSSPPCFTLVNTAVAANGAALIISYQDYVDLSSVQLLGQTTTTGYTYALWDASGYAGAVVRDSIFAKLEVTGATQWGAAIRSTDSAPGADQYYVNSIAWVESDTNPTSYSYTWVLQPDTNNYYIRLIHCAVLQTGVTSTSWGGGVNADYNYRGQAYDSWVMGVPRSAYDYFLPSGGSDKVQYSGTDQASGTSGAPAGYNNVYEIATTTDVLDPDNGDFRPTTTGALHAAGNDVTSTYPLSAYDMTGATRVNFDIGPLENLLQTCTGVLVSATSSVFSASLSTKVGVAGVLVAATSGVFAAVLANTYTLLGNVIAATMRMFSPSKVEAGGYTLPDAADDSWSDVAGGDDVWTDVDPHSDTWSDV